MYTPIMARVRCPLCGSRARRVGAGSGVKAYCGHCGWNLQVARRENVQSLKFCGVAFLVIAAMCGIAAWYQPESLGVAITVALSFGMILAGMALILWVQLWQMASSDSGSSTEGISIPASVRDPENFAEILALPRPRPVRLTWRGWRNVLLYLVMLAIIVNALWPREGEAAPGSREWWFAFLAWALILGWVLVRFLRDWRRDRDLLANGEVVLGCVVGQREGFRSGTYITYAYRDAAGQHYLKECEDRSGSLFEGAPVIVFYDRSDPSQSVVLGCSAHEVVANGGRGGSSA